MIVDTLVSMCIYIFQFHTYYTWTFPIQTFLLGLFFNLTYFLPYLAAISVFTFYCYGIWKSLEKKYFLLKLLIYEECQENNPDANNVNEALQDDEKLQSVVPKEIYDSIRKKLLPYDTNLIWTVLKLLWLAVFSYGVSELVDMLHTLNTTATYKVVATASVGILPSILNTIAWNAGGESRNEAWKKELKENVKRLVKTIPSHKIVLSLPTITQNPENGEPQNPENDEPQNPENGEPQNPENGEPQNPENDEPQNPENDEPQNPENGEPQNPENGEPQNPENGEPQNPENDEPQNPENGEPQNPENDEPQNPENGEPQNPENGEPQNPENGEPQNPENGEPQNPENDEPQNPENDEPQNPENGEPQNPENGEPQNSENDEPHISDTDESLNSENDECTIPLIRRDNVKKDEDIQLTELGMF